MPPLRIIFMGTAELATNSLTALAHAPEIKVLAVVTQPDRPKGRDLKLQPSKVKEVALRENLPVLQPERARHESFIAALANLAPELIVVAAYGQILPQSILDLPRHGCLNVHTSLLPKYRGAAPIQWAILNDEPETGVTIMKMDAGLDTGDILTQASTPIAPEDDSQTLHDRLAQIGARLLLETIPEYVEGKILPRSQANEFATHARKITKEDGQLDWTQPARALWNRVRAFTPWPGAYTWHTPALPKPIMLKIWKAEPRDDNSPTPGQILRADKSGILVACRSGSLLITELQREGGRRLPVQTFLTGNPIKPGEIFISPATKGSGN